MFWIKFGLRLDAKSGRINDRLQGSQGFQNGFYDGARLFLVLFPRRGVVNVLMYEGGSEGGSIHNNVPDHEDCRFEFRSFLPRLHVYLESIFRPVCGISRIYVRLFENQFRSKSAAKAEFRVRVRVSSWETERGRTRWFMWVCIYAKGAGR